MSAELQGDYRQLLPLVENLEKQNLLEPRRRPFTAGGYYGGTEYEKREDDEHANEYGKEPSGHNLQHAGLKIYEPQNKPENNTYCPHGASPG